VSQDLDRAAAAGHRRIEGRQQRETKALGLGAKGVEGALAQLRRIDLAVLHQVAGQFELRLHQHHALGALAQPERPGRAACSARPRS
jgi:hypothetical protein